MPASLSSSIKPLILPRWIHWTRRFQQNALINRGAMDGIGYALPMILLTRNAYERKEKILDRSITIGSAFVLAPLHAWAFYRLFARGLPSRHLMKLPFKTLTSNKAFRQGLFTLAKDMAEDNAGKVRWVIPPQLLKKPAVAEAVRKQLIHNKTHMLLWDLMVEGLIFTNIGFINNWFSKKMTGKNRFVGEIGTASEAELDKLHQSKGDEGRNTKHDNLIRLINTGVAIATPIILALGLKKYLQNPTTKATLPKFMGKIAKGLDYENGIYLGIGSLVVVVGMQFLGYITAARSKYELAERTMQEAWANYLFFLGTPTWMFLLGRAWFPKNQRHLAHSVQATVNHLTKKGVPPVTINKQAGRAAGFFWLSYWLTNACAAAMLYGKNVWTTKKIQTDLAKLHAKEGFPSNQNETRAITSPSSNPAAETTSSAPSLLSLENSLSQLYRAPKQPLPPPPPSPFSPEFAPFRYGPGSLPQLT